jgi:hypothetical protein
MVTLNPSYNSPSRRAEIYTATLPLQPRQWKPLIVLLSGAVATLGFRWQSL